MTAPIDLSSVTIDDMQHILHCMRVVRDNLMERKMLMEVRLATAGPGEWFKLKREIEVCTAQMQRIQSILSKLWLIHANVR